MFFHPTLTNFSHHPEAFLVIRSSSTYKYSDLMLLQRNLIVLNGSHYALNIKHGHSPQLYEKNWQVIDRVRKTLTLKVAATLVKLAMLPPMIRTLPIRESEKPP